MKRVLLIAAAILAVLILGASSVMAAKGDNPANDKEEGVGEANVAFLYLYEKDADWEIVWDGAWGKMKFNLYCNTFDFLFNGHGLEANTDYSLIYYPEPQTTWPWPVTVLAGGTSNDGGNIHLAGSYDFNADLENAKIWLVLTDDIVDGSISGWNPSEYLFEHDLISYDHCDDTPPPVL